MRRGDYDPIWPKGLEGRKDDAGIAVDLVPGRCMPVHQRTTPILSTSSQTSATTPRTVEQAWPVNDKQQTESAIDPIYSAPCAPRIDYPNENRAVESFMLSTRAGPGYGGPAHVFSLISCIPEVWGSCYIAHGTGRRAS